VSGVLLDTYVINDLINDPARLSPRIRAAIAAATGQIYASAASAMELASRWRCQTLRASSRKVE
jgi:PIN domain nuclease of toxin-antitoxin system